MSTSSNSSVFRGDNEDLVDHLIFACSEHKTNQPLEGFGRALVPFFEPGEPLAPLPSKNWQSCGSPPRSSNFTKPPSKAGRKASPPANSTGRPSYELLSTKGSRRACGGSFNGSFASPMASSSSFGTPTGLSSRTSFASSGQSPPAGAACPAFFSSPKPDAIPMPTSGLLNKAGKTLHVGFVIPTAAA